MFQSYMDELKWPKELLDVEWMEKEAKMAAEAHEKYGFKSPGELGYVQNTKGQYPTTADRYAKPTSGPVARQPHPIHESVDLVQVVQSKKRPAAADMQIDEHPIIEAAKDIHGYAPPSVIDQYHNQPHDAVLPRAGVAPEDRPQMNKEHRDFERQNGLTETKSLRDPIAQKKRKTQSRARLAKKAAAPFAQVTRNSNRVKAQQETPHEETVHIGGQHVAQTIAAPKQTRVTAAQSDKPPASAQKETQATKRKGLLQEVASEVHKAEAPEGYWLTRSQPVPSPKRTAPESLEGIRHEKKAAAQTVRSRPSVSPAANKAQADKSATQKRKAEEENATAPAKRPRVNHACDKCREKKTKCNGRSPCEACIKLGCDCVYSDGPAPVLNSKMKKECGGNSAQASSTSANSANAFSTKPPSTKPEPKSGATSKAAHGPASSATASQDKASARKTPSAKPASSRQGRACDQCRVKKTKCDGRRPCEACSKREFTCTYGSAEAFSKLNEFGDSGPSGAPDAHGPSPPGPANREFSARGTSNSASNSFDGCSTQTDTSEHGQKRKVVEGDFAGIMSSRLVKWAKITLYSTAQTAKLRPASGFEALKLSGIPKNIQQSIQERLCLKMRDMMTWKIYHGRGECPEWNIDDRLQEESFHNRPSIKLVIPDLLKGLLVDDWENVTKSGQYVELPHQKATVQKILDDYLAVEKPNREAGSTQMDILEETIDGLREYFDKALGRILLYR